MRETGIYQRLGDLNYFIPHPLPPSHPPIEVTSEMMSLYGETSFYLGQLNEMSERLPDVSRFIKAYVIKEALLSSEIEGIHTTLIDVYEQPLSQKKNIDKNTQLVLNYSKALESALNLITEENFPIVEKVLRQAHSALMNVGEGEKADPGNYRGQTVRVGNLIPPPASEISRLMRDLEKFINEPSSLPDLIKTGLAHVQFETIHPFLDGNGRIGRLLIVLMLVDAKLLKIPIIYPSYFFKKHHLEYYQRLDAVRTKGDFEGWITFFLRGLRDSAKDGHKRAKEIESLEEKIQMRIMSDEKLYRNSETYKELLDILFIHPITDIKHLMEVSGKSYNTIHKALKFFIEKDLVSESDQAKRNKTYRFSSYLTILEKEFF